MPGKRVTLLPKLPWVSQLVLHFLISLQNLKTRLHEKQKVGSARWVILFRWQGPTFLPINTLARTGVNFFLKQTLAKVDSTGRVTLLPETTFLHINGVLLH